MLDDELISGRSLREQVLPQKPVSTRTLVGWVRQLCDGLAAAHACGIVHCDLKPDNVMVEETGRVVITDFGIARAVAVSVRTGEEDYRVEGSIDYLGSRAARP